MKRKLSKRNKRIGSSLDDFLKEEGIRGEATSPAVKRVIDWQLGEAMKAKKISSDARLSFISLPSARRNYAVARLHSQCSNCTGKATTFFANAPSAVAPRKTEMSNFDQRCEQF